MPTATAPPLDWIGIVNLDTLCYHGPDPAFEVVSSLTANSQVNLVGISEKGTYAVLDTPIYPGVNCWTKIGHLTISEEVKALLPPIPDPILPAFTPTFTPKIPTATFTPKPTGSITGVVWKDSNGDGTRQKGETDGINGVTVYLGQGACSSTGYAQKITSGNGNFSFNDLPAGTYCLSMNITPSCTGYTVATTPMAYTINLSPGGSVFKRFGFTTLVCY